MIFVSVDYKQTVTLSFAVTVGAQCHGKMEPVSIVAREWPGKHAAQRQNDIVD